MAAAVTLYRSTIGKKVVMAISGLILVGFVIAHMFGNLKIYEGPEKYNNVRTLFALGWRANFWQRAAFVDRPFGSPGSRSIAYDDGVAVGAT